MSIQSEVESSEIWDPSSEPCKISTIVNATGFDLILDNLKEGVVVTDESQNILYVNMAFTDLTGYERVDILGDKPNILQSGLHHKHFYAKMWSAIDSEGVWEGQIWNRKKNGDIYLEHLKIKAIHSKNRKTTHYVGVFADISKAGEHSLINETSVQQDPLTGLINRASFYRLLETFIHSAQERQETSLLILFDIDRFKNINDIFGHHVGDSLLQQVAYRLQQQLRGNGLIARMGGDEFAILLHGAHNFDVVKATEFIMDTLRRPFKIADHEFFLTGSFGVSIRHVYDTEVKALIEQSDVAMYRAKELGGDSYEFYKPGLHEEGYERISLETELRRALEREEFVLHYQPQIAIETGALTGLEALIRWNNESHGLVSPGKFIPVAEETGLILPIGQWVLYEAAKQRVQWLHEGYDDFRVAVNISARQFQQGDLVNLVKQVLTDTGLPPHLLELEITESMAMRDSKTDFHVLRALQSLGIRIAIDDFGTGYSSLSQLRHLPIQSLKIDRSFVTEITSNAHDSAIAEAIIALAHKLRLNVIAEGVELDSQLAHLKGQQCDEVQGFLMSRPVAAAQVKDFLTNKRVAAMQQLRLGQ